MKKLSPMDKHTPPAGRNARKPRSRTLIHSTLLGLGTAVLLAACGGDDNPSEHPNPVAQGREVFRYETFGNQGFWTDAMQLPQGLAEAKVTPLTALSLGLNVNVEALSAGTAKALTDALAEIKAGKPATETVLNNPAVTLALINEGAVIGVVPFDSKGQRKPLGSDPKFSATDSLDLARGDKVGVSCVLCHGRTDNSVVPAGFAGLAGSVGKPVDGPNALNLDVGNILAASKNPLAYLPLLQMAFNTLDGASIGKGGFTGLKDTATNADVRAYLTGSNAQGERYYGVGTFDALPDGINNAAYTPPFFRTDLAGPWGHSGIFDKLDDFNNFVYTVPLDPTILATNDGKALLTALAGPVGNEIATRYQKVLKDSGLEGKYPYVKANASGKPIGDLAGPAGKRVDDAKLAALRAYTDQLKAPAAPMNLDLAKVARGQQVFTEASCTACHTADPNKPVSTAITPVQTLYKPFAPTTLLARSAPLTDVRKSFDMGPNPAYDNELVVLNASLRGQPAGYAAPLLLGLDGKKDFLHDGSVDRDSTTASLDWLFNPARTGDAPHPFFVSNTNDRASLVEYLRSRTTN